MKHTTEIARATDDGVIVEAIGRKFETDGLPRIAGRIVGHLLLSPHPLTLDEIGGDLQVSKGSASSNARLLDRMGVLERVTIPGDRRDYYRVAGDLHLRLFQFRVERVQDTLDLFTSALETESAESPDVRRRIETFHAFFEGVLETLRAIGDNGSIPHAKRGGPS